MHLNRIGKIIFRVFLGLLIVAALLMLSVQLMAKKSIANFVETKLPSHMQLEYKLIDVNVLTGTAKFKTIDFRVRAVDSLKQVTRLQIGSLEVIGLGYWQFLFNKKIALKSLNIEKPILKSYLKEKQTDTSQTDSNKIGLLKQIYIDEINVANGDVTLLKSDNDSLAMKLDSVNIKIDHVTTNDSLINSKIPVAYGSLMFEGTSLYADLGPYESLKVGKVKVDEGDITISDLKIKSKYSKTKLSWHLHKERDYIDLQIPEVSFEHIDFGIIQKKLWVSTGTGKLKGATLEIFRDKLLPDDTERKKLYSEALRKLPIQLNVPKVEISDSYIAYSERVNRETSPGKIIFDDVHAEILDIQNVPEKNEKTSVTAKALLMGEAPITLNWSFDAKKESDAFTASGTVKNFHSKNINSFLESNLRVRAKGEIQELYFTISGNSISSSGDMKMKYEDFKFSVLKKDRLRINKLLTAIGSLFVNDGSNTDENGYRYGGIKAERDPTKSFFNYLWLNVGDGLTSTIIGNGKK